MKKKKTNIKIAKETVEKEKQQLNFAQKAAIVGAVLGTSLLFANDASSTGDNAFGTLFGIFTTWLQGNLGKILALLGFFGTVVVYMMTHKASVLVIGIIISVLIGGAVGISDIFFNAGLGSFTGGN